MMTRQHLIPFELPKFKKNVISVSWREVVHLVFSYVAYGS